MWTAGLRLRGIRVLLWCPLVSHLGVVVAACLFLLAMGLLELEAALHFEQARRWLLLEALCLSGVGRV